MNSSEKKTKNPQTHLTLTERKEIEILARSGQSQRQIAQKMKRSKFCIQHELNRCTRGQYDAEIAHAAYDKSWKNRIRKIQWIATEEQEHLIRSMMRQDKCLTEIRRRLHWSYSTVKRWFEENEPHYKGGTMNSLEKRIQNLEMQIEILFESIKQLK